MAVDQSNPPPGWEWVDRAGGSKYVRRGGSMPLYLMQAWNIWLTDELEKVKQRIAELESELEACYDDPPYER